MEVCANLGIGFAAGNNVYVRSDYADPAKQPTDYLNVFKHELGHSLSLSHSGRTRNGKAEVYGDSSDPMVRMAGRADV